MQRNPEARKRAIEQEITARETISVEDLCRLFSASPATIRRDLAELEQDGKIKRTYGGASARRVRPAEQAFALREQLEVEEKRAIAALAALQIKNGQTLFLNDGTTVMAVAREIVARQIEVQVATPQVNVALALAACPSVTVLLLGGHLSNTAVATAGLFALEMIDRINADLAMISSDGFSVEDGLTFAHADQAAVAERMVRKAKRSLALVTSSKLTTRGSITAVPATAISTLITNAVPPVLAANFEALGISVEHPPVHSRKVEERVE